MAVRPSFSGHETFPLRFGWLKKALDAATDDPFIFGDDTAIARFGVGKNMVRAIRYWTGAAGVLEAGEERGSMRPTALGRYLFSDDGADPFMEDAGTLWLLHWYLCRAPEPATLWHFVFGHWHGAALDFDLIEDALEPWVQKHANGAGWPSEATLKRDLLCLVGTYARPTSARGSVEDRLGSPLADLGLAQQTPSGPRLRRGAPRALPPWVFVYAVLDVWARRAPKRRTLALHDVLHAAGSPGRVFLLDEAEAFDLIRRVEEMGDAPFSYRDTAGIRQLYRTDAPLDPNGALERHYSHPWLDASLSEVTPA